MNLTSPDANLTFMKLSVTIAVFALLAVTHGARGEEGLGWFAECNRDAMSDELICATTNYDFGLLVFYYIKPEPTSICILGHDFPGRSGSIRVDKNKPVTTDEDGCTPAKNLIGQMVKGQRVITRRHEWPRDYPQDKGGSLAGLSAAMKRVDELRASTK